MEPLLSKDKIEVVLRSGEQQEPAGISLGEVLTVLSRNNWLIAAITAAALVVAALGAYLLTPYKAKARMLIAYSYEGVEKGLDPNGKKLDVGMIKSPYVVNEAIKNLELDKAGISVEEIRREISIEPIIPGNVVEKIKQLQEAKKQNIKDVEDFTYYPSEFTVTLSIPKSMKISAAKGREILTEIIKEYEEYFYLTYSDRAVLADAIGTLDYDEYDYPDISTVIHNQIDIMKNYLTAKKAEASDFRSKRTGLSFSDILESISIIDTVDLSRMDSLIGSFNLTKNKDKLIKLYEYRIKMKELEKAKKEDESKIASEMLEKFEKEKSIIYLPGLTSPGDTGGGLNSEMELEKSSSYYDALAERSTNAGVDAKEAEHDAEYYRKEIERLKNDTVPEDMKKIAEQDVTALAASIKEKLENWIDLTNETVAEYYEYNLYNRAIMRLTPAESSPAVENMKIVLAAALAAGLLIGMLAAFLRHYMQQMRSGEPEGEESKA